MGERPDQLRQEVDRKRDDAARKIDEIEQRVAGTAQRVQEGVAQTTEQVKASVQDSIQGAQQAVGETAQQLTEQVKATTQQVTEQVKSTVDWRKQVEERPLVMAGAAFLGGFVLGSLTGGDDDGHGRASRGAPDTPGYPYGYGGPLYGSQAGAGGQRSYQPPEGHGPGASGAMQALGGAGLMASLRGIVQQSGLQDTLVNAASALVSSAGDRIRSTLEEQVPGFAEQLRKQSGQGGQTARQSPRDRSDQGSSSGMSAPAGSAGGIGQPTEAATSDATGRTAPYFGDQGGRTDQSASPGISG